MPKRRAMAALRSPSSTESSSPPISFVPCPSCGKSFSQSFVQDHVSRCLDASSHKQNQQQQQYERGGASLTHSRRSLFVQCPTCEKSFPQYIVRNHAWDCTDVPREKNIDKARPSKADQRKPVRSSRQQMQLQVAPATCLPSEVLDDAGTAHAKRPSSTLSFRAVGEDSDGGIATGKLAGESIRRGPQRDVGGFVQEDAIQKIMEGSKRAVLVEKAAKIVPRSWPVEVIEDILPADRADQLLVCLLKVSKNWTSYPWYNNKGVEGRFHARSCIYRIHSSGNNNGGGNDDDINRAPSPSPVLLRANTPTGGSNIGSSRSDCRSRSDSGIAGEDANDSLPSGAYREIASETRFHANPGLNHHGNGDRERDFSVDNNSNINNDHNHHKNDNSNNNNTLDAHTRPRVGVGIDMGMSIRGTGRVAGTGAGTTCKMTAVAESSLFGPLQSNKQQFAGPPELLELVPKIVDIVRRRLRERVLEGLGGEENLNWNPNFCICNVYDDHRNYIGAHSDTLSNIGPGAIVTGISLGAKRTFLVEETLPWGTKEVAGGDHSGGGKKLLDMPHNSAVVMWGGCQERYKHGVPPMRKGVGVHPVAGTKRISITLRERKETLPQYLLPIPTCLCGIGAILKARVLPSGAVEYIYVCDRGQGQCGFFAQKALARKL